jgi:amidohydrolase
MYNGGNRETPGDEGAELLTRPWREAIDSYIDSHAERWCSVRRYLHAHPEPSREEYRTTEYLAQQLGAAGLQVRIAPSGRGLIGEPEGQDGQPRIAIRADIDALRIPDAKSVPYRSSREGVMHACGHDAHATMALSAARALWECRDTLPEPTAWRAIFQPAEEVSEGAFEMINAGAVEDVRSIVALHVDPELSVGRIGQRSGVLTACCQEVQVVIRGVGGHAARPHMAVDPIAVAAQLVSSFYQLVPRSVDSRDPTVITFGCIRGGSSPNVIPDQVELLGTIRTLSDRAAAQVEERITQIARGLSAASRATIDVAFRRGTGAVDNDPEVTAICVHAAGEVVGPANVEEIRLPSMGGEDFSGYLKHVPGCLMRLGVAALDRPRHALHSPHFDIEEGALAIGAKVLAHSVVLLSSTRRSRPA